MSIDGIDDPTAEVCAACTHAKENGWWGPTLGRARTHCSRCHRFWRSLRECHCPVCCEHFASYKAADAHRRGRECHAPAEVVKANGEPKLRAAESPYGVVWHVIGTPPTPEQLARLRDRSGRES